MTIEPDNCLAGGGEAGARLRAMDWDATGLGRPEHWPVSLQAAVRILLSSQFPMQIQWGQDLITFYNDAHAASLGHRHPGVQGRPSREWWSDVWDQLTPVFDQVLSGKPFYIQDDRVASELEGVASEAYFTRCHSPLWDDEGKVVGIFLVVTETTRRVVAERALTGAAADLKQQIEALRASEAQQRDQAGLHAQVLNAAVGTAIIGADPEGIILSWNEGAHRITGWSAAEMIGQPLAAIFTDADREDGQPERERRIALETGLAADQRWHPTKSGGRFFAEGSITHLHGPALGYVKAFRDATEDHWAQEALVQSQIRLRRAQEAGGVGIFSIDLKDNIIVGTPEFCRVFGLDECLSLSATEIERLVLPEDAGVMSNAATRKAQSAPLDVEYRIRRADTGEVRWIARKAEYEKDAAGAAVRLVGVVQDVTDRRAVQQALKDSAARFEALAQAIPNHVWTATPEGELDWFNDRVYEYGGAEPGELNGDRWAAMLHPDDIAGTLERWNAALSSGETYQTEFRLRRFDGVYRWYLARAVAIRGPSAEVQRWIGTNTDIEEQRAAQAVLFDLNAALEARVEARTRERDRAWKNSQDLQAVVGQDGVFRAVNHAWTSVLGWAAEEVVGQGYLALIHPDDHLSSRDALATAAHEELPPYETRMLHKDGGFRWISWLAAPEEGLIYASGRHVTAEKEAAVRLEAIQDQLRQSQKMEALGQLTGGIAHDFNNLLTGITGSLDLIRRRMEAQRTDGIDRFMDAASSSAQRAAALTHRLLAFARRQSLDTKPSDVNALVAGLDEMLRRTLGEQTGFATVLDADVWPAMTDANQLESALLNLAINARDAMPNGGTLTIETSNTRLDSSYTQLNDDVEPGDYVVIAVSDTGAGMPASVVAKVFEPFFTTKPIGQGTGLGLSMIYGFVKQSGGHVRIYSELGQGTTVKLFLRRSLVDEVAAAVTVAETPSGRGEMVLVVEDDVTVRVLITEVLEELGYRYLEAPDPQAAIVILESAQHIDLLVTDVGLPNMNGRQLAEIARQGRPDLKVLFVTGYAESAAVRGGFLAPGMEMMTKPFALDALAAKIRQLIEG